MGRCVKCTSLLGRGQQHGLNTATLRATNANKRKRLECVTCPTLTVAATGEQATSGVGAEVSTIACGSLAQTKRRSAIGDEESAPADTININGMTLQLHVPEPNQDDPLAEIAKKQTMGLTPRQKLKQILDPIIQKRTVIIDIAEIQSTATIAAMVADAIPTVTPKTIKIPSHMKLWDV